MDNSSTNQLYRNRRRRRILKLVLNYGIYFVVAVCFVYFSMNSKSFFSVNNLSNMLNDMMPLLSCSMGVVLVITCGELDLSVGSILLMGANMLGCLLRFTGTDPYLGIVICILGVGVVCGAFNGILVVGLGINPWIVTLTTQFLLRGLTLLITGTMVYQLPMELNWMHITKLFDFIPVLTILPLAMLFVLQYILRKTKFGRHLQAIGINRVAAEKIGINTKRVRFMVYIISGITASMAGVLMAINLMYSIPTYGSGFEMYAIMASVIGGTSLMGGKGNVIGAIFGVLVISILENGLSIIGVNVYLFNVIRALIIFVAIYADSIKMQLRIR